MKNQWFRFYNDALNNPKVQKLSPVLFKTWVNLLCVACDCDGILPSIEDVAFSLRLDIKTLNKHLKELMLCGLIDETEQGLQPHNWDDRQFKSDTSKERTKKYRERLKTRKGDAISDNVVTSHVTPQEQSRTDTEEERKHTNAGGIARPLEKTKLKDLVFEHVEPWLSQQETRGSPITIDVKAELERFKTHFLSYDGKDKNGNAVSDWIAKFGHWLLTEQSRHKNGVKNGQNIGHNQHDGLQKTARNGTGISRVERIREEEKARDIAEFEARRKTENQGLSGFPTAIN